MVAAGAVADAEPDGWCRVECIGQSIGLEAPEVVEREPVEIEDGGSVDPPCSAQMLDTLFDVISWRRRSFGEHEMRDIFVPAPRRHPSPTEGVAPRPFASRAFGHGR